MPEGDDTSLEDLQKLIEANERSLRQAKRLLEWLEAHAANESIRRMLDLSRDEMQRQAEQVQYPDWSKDKNLNSMIPPDPPPAPESGPTP